MLGFAWGEPQCNWQQMVVRGEAHLDNPNDCVPFQLPPFEGPKAAQRLRLARARGCRNTAPRTPRRGGCPRIAAAAPHAFGPHAPCLMPRQPAREWSGPAAHGRGARGGAVVDASARARRGRCARHAPPLPAQAREQASPAVDGCARRRRGPRGPRHARPRLRRLIVLSPCARCPGRAAVRERHGEEGRLAQPVRLARQRAARPHQPRDARAGGGRGLLAAAQRQRGHRARVRVAGLEPQTTYAVVAAAGSDRAGRVRSHPRVLHTFQCVPQKARYSLERSGATLHATPLLSNKCDC